LLGNAALTQALRTVDSRIDRLWYMDEGSIDTSYLIAQQQSMDNHRMFRNSLELLWRGEIVRRAMMCASVVVNELNMEFTFKQEDRELFEEEFGTLIANFTGALASLGNESLLESGSEVPFKEFLMGFVCLTSTALTKIRQLPPAEKIRQREAKDNCIKQCRHILQQMERAVRSLEAEGTEMDVHTEA